MQVRGNCVIMYKVVKKRRRVGMQRKEIKLSGNIVSCGNNKEDILKRKKWRRGK